MDAQLRDRFDRMLEDVLRELPQYVQDVLDELPLVVEDFPPPEVLRKLGVHRRNALCGLYTGIPLTQRSVEQWGVLSDVIHLYRLGILAMSRNEQGQIDQDELRRQIRITILHEVGHHHGLGEAELRELGY